MIRCTETKCKLFNDKKTCRNRNQWGICKLSKQEFDKLIADEKRTVETPENVLKTKESGPKNQERVQKKREKTK